MVEPTPIRKEGDTDAIEPVFPGVEAGLGIQLDEKRALSLKTMFLRDDTPEHHEAVLSKLVSVSEVIRLKERLIFEKGELANAERRLQQLNEGDPEIEERRRAVTASLNSALSESAEAKRIDKAKFDASERQGEYRPVGKVANELAGFIKDIDKARDQLAEIDKEVSIKREQCRLAVAQYTNVVIPNIEAQITIRRESYGA